MNKTAKPEVEELPNACEESCVNRKGDEIERIQETEGSLSQTASVEIKDGYLNKTGKPEVEELPNASEESCVNRKGDEIERIQETEGSFSQAASVEIKDGYLNTTTKPKVEELPNASEESCVNDYSSAFTKHFSKKTAKQAMEKLEMVERFQKDGQYADAISCCQSALLLLDSSDDINLRMKFCSNIMQLYFLMDNFDEALNVYYDSCVDVLESVSDPKVIQSIMDLYTLCTNVFK